PRSAAKNILKQKQNGIENIVLDK
ncbi:MAG: hypothetical protein ACD_59C00131G0009, partial [uncultured bacterium]